MACKVGELVRVDAWEWGVIWNTGEGWQLLDYHVSRKAARERIKEMGVPKVYRIARFGGYPSARICK